MSRAIDTQIVDRSDIRTVHRSCNLCEAHCGVAVEVDAERQAVLSVRGDPDDALSRGYVCPKAVGLKGLQEDADRLRRPLRKTANGFEEIGWNEALDLAAGRLREIRDAHGANAIATYLGNPNAHDYGSNLTVPLFLRALGTRWRFSASSVDQLPKMLSSCLLFGGPVQFPVPDVDRTDHLMVLGANPLTSNGSLMTAPDMRGRLRRLRERGGRLVVIDPRRSETAQKADRHVFIRPGSDAFLLMAFVHVLFEEERVTLGALGEQVAGLDRVRDVAREFAPEAVAGVTGVPAQTTRELIHDFADAESAACYGRIGTCTQEFGTLASWLVDVVNTLTGNLDREGGVMFSRPAHASSSPPRRRERVPHARWRSRVRGLPEFAGELPVAALAEEIDTPGDDRVRALVTIAGNPVLSTPNAGRLEQAIGGLDFMLSVDLYLNETTRHADLVLPTTPPLERSNYDMVFHGMSVHDHAKWSPAAVERPDGLLHPWELLLELAARMGGVPRTVVEDLALSKMLEATVGPGTACDAISPEHARERLAELPFPERMLDLMLRAGPHGDRFDDDAAGMSIEKLKAAEHGVDLGALRPQLPGSLATKSGRVELAPELLVDDVERMRAKLASGSGADAGLVLIGRRQLRSNNSWMHNLPALAKGKPRCTLRVAPDDAEQLGLETSDRARVRSRVGEVVVPVEVSDELMPGVVSLPHGFGHDGSGARLGVASTMQPGANSNRLTDERALDELSGNAVLNGIPVDVERIPPASA